MENSVKVYLIIVTYNAMKWAERCFSSLRISSVSVNCIVIDNGSADGTQDFIKTNFPEVDFIQSQQNLGFGKANNLGIEKAYKEGADFFYLMNQDAWIYEDSIEKLLNVYNAYPNKEEIGILSPMHLDGSEKLLDRHFEVYLSRNTQTNRLLSNLYLNNLKPSYEIDFINAAHWFLPKKTIENIGGFSPYFFHGAEDYDYVNRVKYFGKKIVLCTESKVVHDAIQDYHQRKSAQETSQNHRISMRMQRETRYLNPNINYQIPLEKKEFYSNIFKLALKGNFSESKYYLEQFQYFSKRFKDIESLRKTATNDKHPFLNLSEKI